MHSGIRDEMAKRGVPLEINGALDEYGANGDISGPVSGNLPRSLPLLPASCTRFPQRYTNGIECFSVTNGPRQVAPLHAIGHQHVLVEIDLHPKTLGVREIVESEFGAVLRSLV